MSSKDSVELDGTVSHCGAGGIFRVLCSEGHEVVAKLSGKMRQNRIRVVLGDQVKVEVSPYDPTRGRITYRAK